MYWDPTGSNAYNASIEVAQIPTDEREPNDVCGDAQEATLPARLQNMVDEDDDAEDWITFEVAAEDVGKRLYVITSPGDFDADPLVDVLKADCTTSLGGPSSDADFHESFVSDPVEEAGTHYVRVTDSPAFPHAGELYNLLISFPGLEEEVNDTFDTANPADVPVFAAVFGGAGDQDYFAVDLLAGQTLTATVGDGENDQCAPTGDFDSVMEIYDTDGTTSLGFNDDLAFFNFCSEVSILAPADGTYFVRVSEHPVFGFDLPLDYSLSFSVTGP